MDDKRIDQKIRESLLKGTDKSLELKEAVWNNIQQEIEKRKGDVDQMRVEKRRRRYILPGLASVAAAFVIIFFAGTGIGQASVQKIVGFLVPEKIVKQEIEGQEEEHKVSLNKSESGYSIYFDESMYTMYKYDGKDRIVPKLKPDASLPEIFMEIEHVDKSPEELASEIEAGLRSKYEMVNGAEKVKEPIEGILISGKSGQNWNDVIEKYIIVDSKDGGSFIIRRQYFLEAAEGHGARFEYMLREFRIEPKAEDRQ